ncbi:Calumenin [Lasius niger]|uniref:Reticulocalbin-3 n=1 Tax=Lasius niger TaxID=67767 RepID=A0A0J7NY84_LASNI|nr:Calumenin [Lasius niger]
MSKEEYYVISQENAAYEDLVEEEIKIIGYDLTPEEIIRRLGIIVDRIDYDMDGYVTHEELKDWIIYTRRRYIRDYMYYQWKIYNPDGRKDKILWTEYTAMFYGDIDEYEKEKQDKWEESLLYLQITRDRRRWTAADLDGDDALDIIEFTSFTFPQEREHMDDVMVLETIEDIDKDGDGKISLMEYISFMYRGNEDKEEVSEEVKNEIKQFSLHRDKDRDGFLSADEVKTWVIHPKAEDRAETESRFLIYKVDTDGDHELTIDEILEKSDIFVKFIATYYGDILTKRDEF